MHRMKIGLVAAIVLVVVTAGVYSAVTHEMRDATIRTVEFDAAGNAVLGVGGGITADSDPDAEWEECLHKAAPVLGLRTVTAAVG